MTASRPRFVSVFAISMRTVFITFTALLVACAPTAPIADSPPVADVAADPYLWLEDVTGERALDWVRKENAQSAAALTKDPLFTALYDDALAILGNEARIPDGSIQGGQVYNFWQDTERVRGVWRRMSLEDFVAGNTRWEELLDVDALAAREDRNWVFGGAQCLPPARDLCLIRLSDGGTDAAIYREYNVPERRFVEGGFTLPEAKSGVQWVDRDTVLVATDFGEGTMTSSGYPRTVRMWTRGSDVADSSAFVEGKTSDVGLFPFTLRHDEKVYSGVVQGESFFEYRIHMRLVDGRTVVLPLPRRVDVVGMVNGRVIAHLKEDWTHAGQNFTKDTIVALTLDPAGGYPTETVYAPSDSEAIAEVSDGATDVFVVVLDDVIGKLKRVRYTGGKWVAKQVTLPANGTVSISSVNGDGDDLLVSYQSLTVPNRLYYIDGADRAQAAYSLPDLYASGDVAVEQRFAVSADGTRVPYFIMGREDVLARGNAPTIQYGYGGFEIPILPTYYTDPARPQHGALAGKLWVRRGGVLVLSNIRGGGEYGPKWHQSALKTNRQRAFDDFIAIGEDLVASGVTSPAKLGAIGRSNGGLLMGVVLTQRPDLYGAIDCGVPLLDMLRYHKLLAGASWVGEYGSPDNPAERAVLEAYSPYQSIRKEVDYPRVLFYTSTKDDRVHPGHARKMAARMAEMGHAYEYYENLEGGHGGTANQEQLAYRTALEYRFFFDALAADLRKSGD
ncbi:MAG: prolyl oligopeptidase family serine peptidase [Pseudomonadota bacterium]